jgi:hypothetical protein
MEKFTETIKVLIVGMGHNSKIINSTIINDSITLVEKETKTINEIIEEQKTIKYTNLPILPLTQTLDYKSGMDNRRERRAKERKNKKK